MVTACNRKRKIEHASIALENASRTLQLLVMSDDMEQSTVYELGNK
jgi:hypothetical protein